MMPGRDLISRVSGGTLRLERHRILFIAILLLGIFARAWEFGSLPPGLNQDEATNAVDAYSLLYYGVDRNGVSWPVEFIGWGSGVSALYGYALIPFLALGGLTPFVVRLPMLLAGILSLPLMFHVGRRLAGRQFGLIVMFLLSISPWHILASRWGLEANFLPFIFLIAFACLLESTRDNGWFIIGCILLALCLYAYGPAYAAVPPFLGGAALVLLISQRVRLRTLLIGLGTFTLLSVPIGLFIYVNAAKLDTISLGPLTIPRLPGQPRFLGQTAFFDPEMLLTFKLNARSLLALLWKQSDGQVWNIVDPYGYFYRYTLPLAVLGSILLIPVRQLRESSGNLLVLGWLASSMGLGILQTANINRISLVFIPLLIATAACLDWLRRHLSAGFIVLMAALLVGFVLFTRDYHGAAYREKASGPFFAGLLDALDFAQQAGEGPICVTNEVRMPYIFVLFVEKKDPAEYLPTIDYDDPHSAFRQPFYVDRYRFGLAECLDHPDGWIYVLDQTETLPGADGLEIKQFGNFRVYFPQAAAMRDSSLVARR